MKTCAYVRVSTLQQDYDNQKLAILDFAQRQGISVDRFVEAVVSSRRNSQRQQLLELIDQLASEDQLIVSELSRLGRSLGQILQITDTLVKKRIRLISLKENIRLDDRKSMETKVMIALFALFSEIERDLISERTKEGLAKAKEQGRLAGRPKGSWGKSRLDGKEREIVMLLEKGVSKASIAKITGVSSTTLNYFVRTRKLDTKSPQAV